MFFLLLPVGMFRTERGILYGRSDLLFTKYDLVTEKKT